MAIEESLSLQAECTTQLILTEERLGRTRRRLVTADKLEWESLAAVYTSACTEDLIELMRRLLPLFIALIASIRCLSLYPLIIIS